MNSIVDRSSNVLTFSLDVIPPHLMNKKIYTNHIQWSKKYLY